jgi:hypothetical protein
MVGITYGVLAGSSIIHTHTRLLVAHTDYIDTWLATRGTGIC